MDDETAAATATAQAGADGAWQTVHGPFAEASRSPPAAALPDLILLNQDLPAAVAAFLWPQTRVRVCADGAANALRRLRRPAWRPDAIVGDLDSITADVRAWYADALGVPLVHVADQDRTDLQKCIAYLTDRAAAPAAATDQAAATPPTHSILVWGALTGRFDHVLSAVHTAFAAARHVRLWLISPTSVAFVLPGPGRYRLLPAAGGGVAMGPTCGLVPFVGPVAAATRGLRWDLEPSTPLVFGSFISTSNQLDPASDDGAVTIAVDRPVLWTQEILAWPEPHDASGAVERAAR
ncbi:hypothetical protein CXG81DRAFT_11508 [Caulochytrium protostelioides]|uniref:Thiamin pyrophosphokinase thiamin-binding domain-containing protein n=1 Tax=Caulochytrium protostelioides TaxID=1555241 RepID=A0A4P9X943_9FUNG|nr:hypothetical protein CXG81DRAFT_11508 [Caulochytrium protostelioides]|eukprot:RKP01808.1 hypothetical protein CXG81DRAFT_11508 [Caulochytrium protostelioides]